VNPSSSLLYPLNKPRWKERSRCTYNFKHKRRRSINDSLLDVPVNSRVQLMMASVDGIAQGAQTAAVAMTKKKIDQSY
jgi:hypothetical protein